MSAVRVPAGRLAQLLADPGPAPSTGAEPAPHAPPHAPPRTPPRTPPHAPRARPAYRWLATAIRTLAVDGRLPAAARLPGERELANALGLSRTTVTHAYAALVEGGWATARRGSGTFLALPHALVASAPLVPETDVELDLTAAAASAVPGTAGLVERAVSGPGALAALLRGPGYEPVGLARLRAAVAERYRARGLPTDPDQIVVTSGAMAGIAVVIRTVTRPGDHAVVESPSYPSALAGLTAARVRLSGLPVHARDGWDVDLLGSLLRANRGARPRLVYLVPEFQNPTGLVMAENARAEVARTVATAGAVALVDESLTELAFDPVAARPAPLAAHLPDAFCVGSLSKPLWGGVRVGWVRCPTVRIASVRAARLTLDLGASVVDQLIGAEFLESELLTREPGPLLRARVAGLAHAAEGWLDALASHAPHWRAERPTGGLALWVALPRRLAPELAAAALQRGVAVAAGPRFTHDGSQRDRLRLPLTADVPDPAAVVALLRETFDGVARHRGDVTEGEPALPLIA